MIKNYKVDETIYSQKNTKILLVTEQEPEKKTLSKQRTLIRQKSIKIFTSSSNLHKLKKKSESSSAISNSTINDTSNNNNVEKRAQKKILKVTHINHKSKQEKKILSKLNHKNIIKFEKEFFIKTENAKIQCFVMKYFNGGDLFDYMESIGELEMEEKIDLIKKIFREICEAVYHIHSNNIAHCDIKLDNFFVEIDEETGEYQNVVLADFEFALIQKKKKTKKFIPSTFYYRAPETFTKDSLDAFATDIWALGVSFFTLLTGCFPYQSYEDNDRVVKNVANGILDLDIFYSSFSDPSLIDLVLGMLSKNYKNRYTIQDILDHDWLCD
eukprot:TRINITY_DN44099_c0_g1_i1.p1 TRINITY_DN44099_c0_g1~~TRINITY_DN44099_c0_g1_i1.p1  ORF type:complete len:327 (+),score=49.49 TRINITY_DN44099_c0_g1_i1:77-1057(+)